MSIPFIMSFSLGACGKFLEVRELQHNCILISESWSDLYRIINHHRDSNRNISYSIITTQIYGIRNHALNYELVGFYAK